MAEVKGTLDLTGIKALVGRDYPTLDIDRYLSEQPVDRSEIRRYALANHDCNPLWWDEGYAKKTRWGGVMAPPTFVTVCSHSSEYAAIPMHQTPRIWPVPIPGFTDDWAFLFTSFDFEFLRPVRVGDYIRTEQKLIDVQERIGKFAGRMVINTAEATLRNQNDEVVAILRPQMTRFSGDAGRGKSKYKAPESDAIDQDKMIPYTKAVSTARGAVPRYYEDVEVGSEITNAVVRQVTVPVIVAQMTGFRVANCILAESTPLAGDWHYVASRAWRVKAMPAPFDTGPLRPAWVSQMLTDWMGDDGWLQRLNVRLLGPIFAGDIVTSKGRISNKRIENGDHLVDCEFWMENQRGEVSTRGQACIILPSKSGRP